MIIRDLKLTDLDVVRSIVKQNWNENVSYKATSEIREMFNPYAKSKPHYLVAEVEGEVVGYAGFRDAWLMSHAYELIWINIRRDHQLQGIGSALTKARIDRIKQMGGQIILLMTQKPDAFRGFDKLQNMDGWWLMSMKLRDVKL
jgi:GNAT superfamily N-acetyltransferase